VCGVEGRLEVVCPGACVSPNVDKRVLRVCLRVPFR
jgi:hypothetical protein